MIDRGTPPKKIHIFQICNLNHFQARRRRRQTVFPPEKCISQNGNKGIGNVGVFLWKCQEIKPKLIISFKHN